jgi:hypothetical protein
MYGSSGSLPVFANPKKKENCRKEKETGKETKPGKEKKD